VLACVHTLEAPGVPIEYTYRSRVGLLKVSADSYALDLRRGVLSLRRLRISDPKGNSVAELDSLRATGLEPLRGSDQIIRVRGNNLKGRLVRQKDGRFEFQNYLPESNGAPGQVPYDVVLDQCRLEYLDRTGPKEWSQWLHSPLVSVAGVGRNWIASAKVQISGCGEIATRVQNQQEDGLLINGSTGKLELASILAHFFKTPEGKKLGTLADFSSASLVAQGPFRLVIPRGKPARFESTIRVNALMASFQQFKAASLDFNGFVNAQGAIGAIKLHDNQATASLQGSSTWSSKPQVAGSLIVDVDDSRTLPNWAKPFLPKGSAFHKGNFHGWISARSKTDYRLTGQISAAAIHYSGEDVDSGIVQLDANPQRVVMDIKHALYNKRLVLGGFTLDRTRGTLVGAASTENLDIARVANRLGYHQVEGTATISASVSGQVSDPTVSFVARGQGKVALSRNHVLSLGRFEGLGKYSKGDLQLDRAYFDTPEGLISAHGALGRSGSLGISVSGRGIQLDAYSQAFSGTANCTANITGTLRDPIATGRVEAFDITYKDHMVPAAVANFRVDRFSAAVSALEAVRGTTSIVGNGHYEFKTKKIAGSMSAQDIQIADWLGNDYVGAIDVPSIEIGGTADQPLVLAHALGSSLVLHGVKVDSITSHLQTDGNTVAITDLNLVGADGRMAASGTYDIHTKVGKFSAAATEMSLDKLAPDFSDSVAIEGRVSGKASIDIHGRLVTDANVDGQLNNISLNGSLLGSGPMKLRSDGKVYSGSIEIGDLQRYITVDNVSYDPDTKRLSGDLNLFNVRAENLVSASLRYFPNTSTGLRDSLESLKGSLNASSSFDGTLENPSVTVGNLSATGISFRNQPMGELDASFALNDHKWDIKNLKLLDGPLLMALNGTVEEKGEIHIDGNTDNRIDLSKLGGFNPRLSAMTGNAHFWFSVDGPTRSPRVEASVKASGLFANSLGISVPHDEDNDLRFNLDKIEISESEGELGGFRAEGEYFYKGLSGTLSGSAPFEYPFKIGSTGPAKAKITLTQSNLQDIAPLIGGIDATRTSGTVVGEFAADGEPFAMKITGSLQVLADSLSFHGMGDTLKSVNASITVAANALEVKAQAQSSRGGSISASASTPVQDIGHLYAQYQKGGAASFLDSSLTGHASINRLQFRQNVFVDSPASGNVTADLDFSGSLRTPAIGGQVKLSNGDLVFKGLSSVTSPTNEYTIDPRFDLKLTLIDPSHIQSSTANLYLLGDGILQGTLLFPKATASLYVDKGSIRLPASLLRLDQGGTVSIDYQSTRRGATASANVDLEGTTSVTTSRSGEVDIQRYVITLGMKGNLLDSKGISLTASSDPPDLTQDQILAILGQGDFLQTMSNGFNQSQAAGAVAQFVLPSLIDPIAAQLARGVGLDYLNVEYNMFDQASVTFGKGLGSGFSVVGLRQISEPLPGIPPRFDLRLVYRPRRLPGALRQIQFFFGADQDFPWKLGLDYGIRF